MPGTATPSVVLVSVTLAVVSVAAFMASLKVAVMRVLLATPTAPAAGTVTVTVGRVVSSAVAAPVVKLHTKAAASAMPVLSCTPVPTVATQSVLGGNGAVGVSVAICVAVA